jgi:hypothetical protein
MNKIIIKSIYIVKNSEKAGKAILHETRIHENANIKN